MRRACAYSATRRRLGRAAVALLLIIAAPLVSSSSKYACDYSNRLCQWNPSYMFGGTVMGDLAFFNGGILSNDATTPVNGSAFEVLDLRTMSPLVVQVEDNKPLQSSRYRHQLVVWRNKILAVGGQQDDSNGASQQVINVIELDLNTRQWALRKQFTQPQGQVEVVFEASVVVDDQLLIVFVTLEPGNAKRTFLSLDLNSREVNFNYNLGIGAVQVLDWPLIGVMTLGKNGDFPHLVVQAKRQLPKSDMNDTAWFEVTGEGDVGVEGPLPFTTSTPFKKLPGGDGGKVLALKILRVLDKPRLLMWALTTATFPGGRKEVVNAVSMYDVDVSGPVGKRSISLQLSRVFLTLPYNIPDFSGLQSVDLPLHGNLAVTAAGVTALPYVGQVDLIGDLDAGNVNILEWPDKGFIIRGSSLANYQCQQIATWQPFVLSVDLTSTADAAATPTAPTARPLIQAVSNSSWCSTRRSQLTASEIVGDANGLETNAKLFSVGSSEGPMLVVLDMKRASNPGNQLQIQDITAPLRGAFISIGRSTVHNFSIPATEDYSFALGYASCVTTLAGSPIYLQTGGQFFNQETEKVEVDAGFVAVPLQLEKQVQPMLKVSGGSSTKGAIFPALACTADGTVYAFGGLVLDRYKAVPFDYDDDGKPDITVQEPVWAASNSLTTAKLGGSLSSPSISKPQQLGPAAAAANSSAVNPNIPAPRNGHVLMYLPPETVVTQGFSKGALLLYGGSNVTEPSLSTSLTNESVTADTLANITFDRGVWLFDLGASKWIKLVADGISDAPPGLMYHSAAVQGKQVILWGGLRFLPQNKTLKISTDLYILDFSQSMPRWRKAAVDNINVQGAFQLGFPNTGIAPLPESGAVALMHKSGISLTAMPQSLQPSGPAMLSNWGLNTLNLTAGDWVRLEVPTGQGLTVQQPLLLGSDIIITGISTAGAAEAAGTAAAGTAGAGTTDEAAKSGSRGLLQQRGEALPVLRCGKNATSAVSIKSSGAVLEGLSVTGCNGSAINISVDATGSFSTPATLRNLRISGNNGSRGAAVHIGPAAAAVLENCIINNNRATDGSILAQFESQLSIINSTLAGNQGSGVVFAGSVLNVTGSSFVNNTAVLPVASPVAKYSLRAAAVSGGAFRIVCQHPSLQGCNSNSVIVNSTFTANAAQTTGGAVYLGAGTFARLEGSNFSSNAAADGGAVLADRDACLYNMTAVRFRDNRASSRGGAVLSRGAGCRDDMVWQRAVFFNNTAGVDGGAMYMTEMINRNISGQAAFNNNTVTGIKPLGSMVTPTVPGIGNGGALFLGLWNSNVTLYNTTFVGNNATGSGGAVEVLSIESNVTLINTTALGNLAGQVVLNSSQAISQAVRSEGGAVHVQGSTGELKLVNVNMTTNRAGRGGAVSVNSELGGFISLDSSFADNLALTAGGAVAVTERKTATISNSTFERNHLWWPEIAAGGGFYCFLCDRVSINDSHFESNIASYGGGAAILQASGPSSIVDTTFVHNVALPGLTYQMESTQRRRLQAAAPQAEQAFAGQAASDPRALQHVPADILGPIAGNTTGDSGFYTGGGGLYVSVNSRVDLNGNCFADNRAWNGGGLVARTDACPGLNSLGIPCQLRISQVSILDGNLATAAGGGLLVTRIDSPWVQLSRCSAGNTLNLTTSSNCLQQPNRLCQARSSHSRLLLQDTAAVDPSAMTASGPVASLPGDFLATSAAAMQCRRLVNVTSEVRWIPEDCNRLVQAGPGIPIDVAVQLFDGLGRPISSRTYDAQMPMEAAVLNPDGVTRPDFLLIGNTTQAVNGTGFFPGLRIHGWPGTQYQLVFRTRSGLNLTRRLVIRECQAGEHNMTQQVASDQSSTCELCSSPEYSFYPQAPTCGLCALLGTNSYSVCNAAAVVPANGRYQSHPRSPLLHRCITAAACGRSTSTQMDMADWAAEHAGMTITQLNQINSSTGQPYYQPYNDMMCAKGYSGPLCGACTEGHGHSAQRCIRCMNRSLNSFSYFLVCVFMFIVPALQTLLHSKNVQKRHQQRMGVGGGFASAQFERAGSGAQGMVGRDPKRGWVEERVPEEVPREKDIQLAAVHKAAAVIDDDVGVPAHFDQTAAVQSLTPYVSSQVGTAAAEHNGVDETWNGNSSAAPVVSLGPFGGLGTASGSLRQHSKDQQLPAPTAAAATAEPAAVQPVARPKQQISLFAGLFSVETLNKGDYISNSWSVTAAPSTAADDANGAVACKPHDPAAAAAANGQSGAKRPKFYHSDVLTMLVSYMQLLGLLRLIRLDWSEWLRAVMSTFTYLDFTSGTSTWVSLECSFADSALLPKSLKRSLVLMLWPIGALLFLAITWWIYAYMLSRGRGITRGVRFQLKRLEPYLVLSAVTMIYFLYTPTSREIISLFSCQPVDTLDALQRVAPQSSSTPDARDALLSLTPKNVGWQGVWTSDTNVLCASPAHLGIAIGLGVPGLIVWVFGLPVALWLMLRRNSKVDEFGATKLENPVVELKYGLMYDKYRYKRYYWECVVLLENCALTMLLVLLQAYPAPLQILVAMAVIFIGAILHITFKPYVVKMLDTLRRLAVYTLMGTLFFMMLVTLSEFEETPGLPLAALVVIVVMNLVVLGIHLWAVIQEVRRWVLFELGVVDRDYLTWGDVRVLLNRTLRVACGGRLQGAVQGGSSSAGVAAVPGSNQQGKAGRRGPPKEYVTGTPNGADVV